MLRLRNSTSDNDNDNSLYEQFKRLNISYCYSYSLSSIFENTISEQISYGIICEYLDIKDTISLLLSSKAICNNKINRHFTRNNIRLKASNIIKRFMERYTLFMINNSNHPVTEWTTRRNVAAFYFRHYPKNCIHPWYNTNTGAKKDMVDEYITLHTDSPTRLDLFNLIRKMPAENVLYVGW